MGLAPVRCGGRRIRVGGKAVKSAPCPLRSATVAVVKAQHFPGTCCRFGQCLSMGGGERCRV
jgi:hypothetical protein